MTDLDARLRSLRATPLPDGPAASDLRRRAARRTHRRRVAALATAVPALLVVVLLAVTGLGGDDPTEQVRTDPAPAASDPTSSTTTTVAPGPEGTRVLGDVEGVTVEVTPRTDLRDGDLVTVRIEGLEQLPDAQLLLCAGDVTEDDAATSCGSGAIQQSGTEGQVFVQPEQTVSVSRSIGITRGAIDPNRAEPFDCATEPAGCVLAVAPFELPPRGVLVPLTFVDDGPTAAPTLGVSPGVDLVDGQDVTVRAEGLRPNGAFSIGLCGPGESVFCEEAPGAVDASSGVDGALEVTIRVASVVYSAPDGRTDCTAVPCVVRIRDAGGQEVAQTPIRFASGVAAPVPQMAIDPPGPYTPGQEVTVTGTGFPAGARIRLGQCPVDQGTDIAERCSYPISFMAIQVEPGGTFTATGPLAFWNAARPCGPRLPCTLGWVLNKGPLVVDAPLPPEG